MDERHESPNQSRSEKDFLPYFLRTGIYTMPEFLEVRYSGTAVRVGRPDPGQRRA